MTAPFRLGIITDEISQDIHTAIALAKQYGLEALELRSVDGKQLYLLEPSRIEEIRSAIAEAGLAVCGLSTPVFKCELDRPEDIEQHVEMLCKYVELAQTFGTGIIRGFSFWSRGNFEDAFDAIVSKLQNLVPILEEANVVFALEFDPAVYATNAAKAARIVRAVNSPFVRALFDPGNDLWDPDHEVPYPDGYLQVKDLYCHVHLKDAVRNGDEVEGVAIGQGEVDYRGLFKQLLADRYEGYVVVETHYRLRSRLTEEQLKRPAGYAFSEGGEEASRECLDSLFSLFEELQSETFQREA